MTALLKRRAIELEAEFLVRLRQSQSDITKAREQLLFLEKGCDAAEAAMQRARNYSPIIDEEYACPNCHVRMNIRGVLHESPQLAESPLICRKCGAGFHMPKVE